MPNAESPSSKCGVGVEEPETIQEQWGSSDGGPSGSPTCIWTLGSRMALP